MTREELRGLGWELEEEESETQRQFREDMVGANRKIRFYEGRFFYKGWAADATDFIAIQVIIRATSVTLRWDQFGKDGWIVYPL